MSKICTHDNEETCSRCKPRPEKCWQLTYKTTLKGSTWFITEFHSGNTKKVPKKYFMQINKISKRKARLHSRLCNYEMMLTNIIGKVLKGKKK